MCVYIYIYTHTHLYKYAYVYEFSRATLRSPLEKTTTRTSAAARPGDRPNLPTQIIPTVFCFHMMFATASLHAEIIPARIC